MTSPSTSPTTPRDLEAQNQTSDSKATLIPNKSVVSNWGLTAINFMTGLFWATSGGVFSLFVNRDFEDASTDIAAMFVLGAVAYGSERLIRKWTLREAYKHANTIIKDNGGNLIDTGRPPEGSHESNVFYDFSRSKKAVAVYGIRTVCYLGLGLSVVESLFQPAGSLGQIGWASCSLAFGLFAMAFDKAGRQLDYSDAFNQINAQHPMSDSNEQIHLQAEMRLTSCGAAAESVGDSRENQRTVDDNGNDVFLPKRSHTALIC